MFRKRVARLVSVLALTAVASSAQTAIAPPTSGLILRYQFWPEQYVQWIDNDLPYSMLELDVDAAGKSPIYNVALVDRATLHRVQYTNSDEVVALAKREGYEAHKTQMVFEPAGVANVGATSTLRLVLADGKSLQWRFVQGSDLSERGSGLTPLREAPMPVFAFREQGSVAGDGTAVQIDKTVSVASPWDAYSVPPYFTAYRGAYTIRAHRLTIATGKEVWMVTSYPKSLTAGQAWEMKDEQGTQRTLTISKVAGDHYTFTGKDSLQPTITFVLEASRVKDEWAIEQIRYIPDKAGEKRPVQVQFSPALTADTGSSNFTITFGKGAPLASGSLALSGATGDRTTMLEMKTPPWAAGKDVSIQSKADGESLTLVSTAKP